MNIAQPQELEAFLKSHPETTMLEVMSPDINLRIPLSNHYATAEESAQSLSLSENHYRRALGAQDVLAVFKNRGHGDRTFGL